MGQRLILETTFLVDLEREQRAGRTGAAHAFLESRSHDRFCLTLVTAGEIASGMEARDREQWERFVRRFEILPTDLDACWEYGRAFRFLKDNGILIGANDLWIAATALAHDVPVVTENERHFRRVPGLIVLGYKGK